MQQNTLGPIAFLGYGVLNGDIVTLNGLEDPTATPVMIFFIDSYLAYRYMWQNYNKNQVEFLYAENIKIFDTDAGQWYMPAENTDVKGFDIRCDHGGSVFHKGCKSLKVRVRKQKTPIARLRRNKYGAREKFHFGRKAVLKFMKEGSP